MKINNFINDGNFLSGNTIRCGSRRELSMVVGTSRTGAGRGTGWGKNKDVDTGKRGQRQDRYMDRDGNMGTHAATVVACRARHG